MNLGSILTLVLSPAVLEAQIRKQWPHLAPELVTLLASLVAEYLQEQLGVSPT